MDDPLRGRTASGNTKIKLCLNPCCNGWSSKSGDLPLHYQITKNVLILVLMDDPLRV